MINLGYNLALKGDPFINLFNVGPTRWRMYVPPGPNYLTCIMGVLLISFNCRDAHYDMARLNKSQIPQQLCQP